jgi:hypothetical protein
MGNMKNERIIIVGGPRRGKSTLAQELRVKAHHDPTREHGTNIVRIFCGDPLSKVKEPRNGVTYLPEGIPISGDDGAAQWVADNWFPMPGPWVCEGWVMARALRRWVALRSIMPADRIVVLDRPAFTEELRGQASMHKAVMTVWHGISHHFAAIAEYL